VLKIKIYQKDLFIVQKRSFQTCNFVASTDISRKKYLLRHNNEWIVDPNADKLLTMTFNKMTKKENFLSS
jgi:hypothetical protein